MIYKVLYLFTNNQLLITNHAEGEGLEPPSPYGRLISSQVPYQLG